MHMLSKDYKIVYYGDVDPVIYPKFLHFCLYRGGSARSLRVTGSTQNRPFWV